MATAGPEEDLSTLISRQDHLNILRYIRAQNLRDPTTVVKHGKLLLGIQNNDGMIISTSKRRSNIGDAERLAALEQLCIASLDVGDISLAEYCLDDMQGQSSGNSGTNNNNSLVSKESTRFRKLLGMCLEASGDYDGATAIYDKLLADNPSNSYAAKRKYCILAAQGKEIESMKVLNEYLSTHPGDIAAWHTMAEVCLSVSDFMGAAYCYEEVILGCPLDSNMHTKLGEVYCSAGGGLSNCKLARKHLAQAVQLDPNNLRAWYGLIAASESYLEEVDKMSSSKGSKKEAEEEGVEVAKELIKFGGEKLMQVYKGTDMLKIVERLLQESSELL